ncbi:hypothetical protein GCM10008107_17790 [Psychrosphaera saromensis]|uniref:Uncharacterized protein n=1 Tax=Psychrosphaera saromensis TaxID=716813 RepID=A0A2S7UT98_9GAMM|nr:hypothetical protein [Psychrosphaera saromensis]PQJ52501.1 hypothetical protein BTO11_01785 [Psychrosphaera saromensis]GHB69019.1 hypothetical protein GCM10008107_17790 [Psychrosphaera saromensis]GLQ12964.1 hypothetical protein GCM10007917_04190 [Psychrosphaera saromensis]
MKNVFSHHLFSNRTFNQLIFNQSTFTCKRANLKQLTIVFISLFLISCTQADKSYTQVVANAQLTEVASTINLENNKAALKTVADVDYAQWSQEEKQSALLLTALGCIDISTNDSKQSTSVNDCEALAPLSIDYPSVPSSLTLLLNQLVSQKIVQGYNVKEQTLVTSNETGDNIILYGHSSLIHAKQLISLLTISNIDFIWQVIAKESAFNIRDDWQDIQPDEKISRVRIAKEYDVRFTFADNAEQLRFMPLINQYAKKDSDDETGLIKNAWWQPFYRTFAPQQSFMPVKRISLQADGFVASTLVLPADLTSILNLIKSNLSQTDVIISSEDVWVNPAFYRYLEGDYK